MAVVRCFQRKRGPEGRLGAKTRPEQANPSAGLRKGEIARRRAEAPSAESASKRRETVPPNNIGGGGGNRTHVRWTVLARPYERSLRFIFARRKPTGGPLAGLVRSCSPLPPTNLGVPGKLALFAPKPTALARSGGRRYLRSECQRCFVGSYTGARFVEITRLGSRLAAPSPPSSPFAPTVTTPLYPIVGWMGTTTATADCADERQQPRQTAMLLRCKLSGACRGPRPTPADSPGRRRRVPPRAGPRARRWRGACHTGGGRGRGPARPWHSRAGGRRAEGRW